MRVEVRQRHIDQALALRAARGGEITGHDCPLALAMKEQTKLPLAASAVVGYMSAQLYMAGQFVGSYTTSAAAQRFISMFDDGMLVKPHTFQLTRVE